MLLVVLMVLKGLLLVVVVVVVPLRLHDSRWRHRLHTWGDYRKDNQASGQTQTCSHPRTHRGHPCLGAGHVTRAVSPSAVVSPLFAGGRREESSVCLPYVSLQVLCAGSTRVTHSNTTSTFYDSKHNSEQNVVCCVSSCW